MSSEIRVNKINNRSGLSTVTFTNTGPIISGVTTFQDRVDFESNGLNVTSGSVGIGTDNPGNPLHVLGADPQIKIQDSENGVHAQIFLDGPNSNLNFDWESGSQRNINLINSGSGAIRVGVATDNPTTDLHVFGSTDASAIIDGAAGDGLLTLRNAGNTNWSGINFTRERSTGTNVTGGSIWMPSDTSNNSATLYIQTQSASANAGESGALTDSNGVRLKLASQPGGVGADSAFSVEVGSSESLRIDSNGLKFNGDTAAANALDDYEEGNITTWRLRKDGASTAGSNNGVTHVRYTKIGRCVYISGHIRTDSTQDSQSGNALLVTVADADVAATLPFTPNHTGGIPITHTRTINELDHPISLAFVKDSATIYIYANDTTGDYIADSNTLSTNTQTNLVITFSGHFFTDS